MILKRVKLNNFISHEDTEIEFPFGVTAIVGPNGAGKTSIVDAIVFALFGDRVRGEKFEDLIRRGGSTAEVELTFEEGGKDYKVSWIRRKRGVEATLLRGGKGIATGKDSVTNEISNILRMDKESVMNSIFVRQGEITRLIDEEPRIRKNLIGKLIGLDRLEKSWGKMREVIDHFDDIKNKLKADIQGIERELKVRKEQRDKLEKEMKGLKSEIKKLKQDLVNVKNQLKQAEKELREWDKRKKKYDNLKEELGKVDDEINKVRRMIEELEKELKESKKAKRRLKKLRKEIAELDGKLKKVQDIRSEAREAMEFCKDYEEVEGISEILSEVERCKTIISTQAGVLIEQIEKKEKELGELKSKALEFLQEIAIEAKNSKVQELKARREELDEKISELGERRGRIKGRINDLKEALEMLGDADTCPVCKTKLTPEHREKVKNEMRGEIEDLEKDLKRIKREIKECKSERKIVNDEIENVSRLDIERIEKLEREITNDKEKLAGLRMNLRAVEQKANELESKIMSNLSNVNTRIGEERNVLEKLEIERKGFKEDIEKIEYDESKHKDARKNYENKQKEFVQIKTKLEEKDKSLKEKKEDLEKENEKISGLENDLSNLKVESEKVDGFIRKLNSIRNAFSRDGVQKMLRQKLAPLISEYARNYLERFNLDIINISVSEDFDITVGMDGGEISIKSMSGGEKVAVAIALRLAIAKVLAGRISTIIMDEPTTHLDEERRRELVEIMKGFFRGGSTIPQMIIVTHHRELEDVADTVYLVEKVDGISRVVEEV